MDPTRLLAPLALAGGLALPLIGPVGCSSSDGRPGAVPDERAGAISLQALPFAELTIPPDSRPAHAEPPAAIPLEGAWRYVGATRKGMHKYATDIPIRPRGLFFHRAQPGMVLRTADGEEVRYDRFGHAKRPMWTHDRHELIVYLPERGAAPEPGAFVLSYPLATTRERALNRRWSPAEADADFAWTSIQADWDNRRGLLLPAPGVAAWDLEVPAGAELSFVSGLVEPELRVGAMSDGASFTVEVEAGGEVTPVHTDTVDVRAFEPQRIDLSGWAGQQVRVRVRTEPGPAGNTDYDYVFLAEPAVTSRKADPVRVVMVFIDTLRPDHLSLYGYERDTSVAIDHLKDEAAVFTQARSVAPWTLPSARTIVTGRHPEYYDASPTLQRILGDRGWATGFIAGNVYLSVNFEMTRDWDFHRVGLWPLAEEATDDALRWLEEHDGRDALLQVHYMGTHLPYVEPPSYRDRYAGAPAGGLREEFHLSDVRRANVDRDPAGQQYVKDRYDNNVRYVTDQVRRILDTLDDNDVLLVYSDHGEEFWDHQGFEHGHTLYEELLHIPLIVDAPGVGGQTVDAPVSLLDLTPTVLDLVGVEPPGPLDGRSLVPLLRGEPGADEPFRERDLAFGRPLYGAERWGLLRGTEKWTTTEGGEAIFDLSADPGEQTNLLGPASHRTADTTAEQRAALGEALGREVGAGYQLSPTNHRGGQPIPGLWVMCTVPGGFREVWQADDPLESSEVTLRTLSDPAAIGERSARYGIGGAPGEGVGGAEICWHEGKFGSREVYLVPQRDLAEVGHQMVCTARYGSEQGTMRIPAERDPTLAGPRAPALTQVALNGRTLSWRFGVGPIPNADTQPLQGQDDEMGEMLEALGYADRDAPAPGALAPDAVAPDAAAAGPSEPAPAGAVANDLGERILRACPPPR
jgi:arylsulfatase A-like enzyme